MNLSKVFPLIAITAVALVGCEKKSEEKAPDVTPKSAPVASEAAPAAATTDAAPQAPSETSPSSAPSSELTEDEKIGLDEAFKEFNPQLITEIKALMQTEEGKKQVVDAWKSSGMSDAMIQGMIERISK